jgi:hypothetical protein
MQSISFPTNLDDYKGTGKPYFSNGEANTVQFQKFNFTISLFRGEI